MTARLFALLFALSLLAACESGTEPPVDVPEGLALTRNDVIVARVMDGTVEGAIHVHLGEYSGLFIVDILNGRGEPMPLEPDHRLEATVGHIGLVTFVQHTPGAFRGEFEMFGEGETTITFRLVRDGSGAAEWSSPPLDLIVLAC
ncbi:MAG: hypothetical protein RLN75_04375 [Longimicrobiales bacterium]